MKPILSIIIAVLIISCQTTQIKRKSCRLQVAVSTKLLKYLDYPVIYNRSCNKVYFDSVHKQIVSVFDSLTETKTTVSVFSIITEDLQRTVSLKANSTIALKENLFANFIGGNQKNFFKSSQHSVRYNLYWAEDDWMFWRI